MFFPFDMLLENWGVRGMFEYMIWWCSLLVHPLGGSFILLGLGSFLFVPFLGALFYWQLISFHHALIFLLKFGNQRTSNYSFLRIFRMKEPLLMVFLKSFQKPTFSQNNQQRIGNFIKGYLIGSQIYETIFI